MPISNVVKKNPFETPATKQAAGFGSGITGLLSSNTRPFNPATAGTFDTAPKLATPSSGNVQGLLPATNKTALGTSLAAPASTLKPAPAQPYAAQQQPMSQQMTTPSGLPITGNPATFAGVPQSQQASQIQQTPSQPFSTPTRGLFPDVVSALARRSLEPSQAYTQGQELVSKASKELADYKSKLAEQMGQEELRAIPLEFVQGRQQVLARQGQAGIAEREAALTRAQEQVSQSLTQQGLEQQALSQAAGFAPEAVRYGAYGTQGAGGQFDPTSAAQQYAQEVANGTRSYEDAVSAMGLYGSAGQQFLDQAIRSVNPSFNFAQARSLGDIQGMIGPQYNFAQQALQNVENAFQKLGATQKTNVPLWNQFANFVSLQSGVGGDASREFVSAVQSLRNAYAAILASARGGTPSDFSAQAIAEIPDIPTPNDLAAIRHNLETLGQARVGIYGQPGGSSTPSSSTSGSVGWF